MSIDSLFRPLQVRSLRLPNRIVMAPMTRSFSPGGIPTAEVAAYYRRRAQGEVGLIITEGTVVERPAARNDANVPVFHGDALPQWQRVADEVHAAGGRIAPQLWHVGSSRGTGADWRPLGRVDSPSGLVTPGKRVLEPMTEEDIADTIAAFGRSARAARELGFDAVEIHGAHGYLIDQFFWGGLNVRTDRWGGATIGERAAFGAEVVRAVRAGVGEDIPVILRLSQWKAQDFEVKNAANPRELEAWLTPLSEAGVDVFHCSQRRFWEPEFADSELNFAGWAKKITGKPTITVGSVGLDGEFIAAFGGASSRPASLDGLVRRLEAEEFDLVAVGRALLADPQWLRKIRDGRHDELGVFERSALATLS
ncbi:NADH:flavin oxidoreductase [Nannocystis punicea]|uniref:NADH:flavin oxidoreductase n=1 Tax=Nannocystis punicea TaxID=2995304 RepID=A0ABY7GT04_9BACT|nr:NADH:flavin oxidoreductase [Nannocystis poenicansa]WAS90061.1 NADH:flavin oxidoreductase [Nannocystis poenicansa]